MTPPPLRGGVWVGVFGGVGGSEGEFFRIQISDDSPPLRGGGWVGVFGQVGGSGGESPPRSESGLEHPYRSDADHVLLSAKGCNRFCPPSKLVN